MFDKYAVQSCFWYQLSVRSATKTAKQLDRSVRWQNLLTGSSTHMTTAALQDRGRCCTVHSCLWLFLARPTDGRPIKGMVFSTQRIHCKWQGIDGVHRNGLLPVCRIKFLYSHHCVLYSHRCVLYTYRCVLYSYRCVLYTYRCVLYSHRCVLYSYRCVLYTYRCVLYSHRCVLYSQRCVLYSQRCVLYAYRCSVVIAVFRTVSAVFPTSKALTRLHTEEQLNSHLTVNPLHLH